MGHISWLREVPEDTYLLDPISRPTGERHILITLGSFLSLNDYTRSMPTGPSPGRVYRKNLHWTKMPANWFVYVCEADPTEEGYTLHHPFKPILIDEDPHLITVIGDGSGFRVGTRG